MLDFRSYRRDCLAIMKLGLPVLISQVGLIVVGFADNIMVGHYSTQALASASFVNNFFNIPMFCAMGFSYGLTPLVGALFSQGREERIGLTLRAGVYANMIVALVLTLVMGAVYFRLDRMGQPAHLLPIIRPYYLIYLCGLVPVALFNCFAQWSYGVKRTAMPMWILLGCNALNIAGNYILIFGNFGAPELGLTGAGISTLVARVICPVAIMSVFFFSRRNRRFRSGFVGGRLEKGVFGQVFRTSWPVSLQMSFETASFSGCAILAGWLGEVPMAAFQVIVIVGMLGFCIYYSIGTSISVLVANEAGQGSRRGMRRVAGAGYFVILCFAALSSTVFVVCGESLARMFTSDAMVLAAAVGVLFPLVLYQLGDATQICFANALRGTARVMPMMWIAFVSYIVVGLPVAWAFAFPCGMGLFGIVLSFSVPLFLAGGLFLWFFMRVTGMRQGA